MAWNVRMRMTIHFHPTLPYLHHPFSPFTRCVRAAAGGCRLPLSAFRSSVVLFSTLGFFLTALYHRNTPRKDCHHVMTLTSPLAPSGWGEALQMPKTDERAERRGTLNCCLEGMYFMIVQNQIDVELCRAKVMWWPFVCRQSAVISEFCTASSPKSGKIHTLHIVSLHFKMPELHVMSSVLLSLCLSIWLMVDEWFHHLIFSRPTVASEPLDGQIDGFSQSSESILLIKLQQESCPRSHVSPVLMKTAVNCSGWHDASRWNNALWKLHQLEIPQHCCTCTLQKFLVHLPSASPEWNVNLKTGMWGGALR